MLYPAEENDRNAVVTVPMAAGEIRRARAGATGRTTPPCPVPLPS